mgnify:CR=1 FL=1
MYRFGFPLPARQHRLAMQTLDWQEHRPQGGLRVQTSLRDIEWKFNRPHFRQLKRPAGVG